MYGKCSSVHSLYGRPELPASQPHESNSPVCRQEDAYAASKRLLNMAGVRLRQHKLDRPLVFCIGTETHSSKHRELSTLHA